MQRFLKSQLLLGALALAGAPGLGCIDGAPGLEQQEYTGSIQRAVVQDGIETISQELINDYKAVLKERQSVPVYHPELMPPHLQPDLNVTEGTCKVWVTFVDEGAGRRNSLGFFTYPDGQRPTSPPSLATRKANIIFANASKPGSGGTLQVGTRMLLGSFPVNTRIGFYLIAGSCSTDNCTVNDINFNAETYYTIDEFNPEVNPANKRHVLLLEHADAQRKLLSFENQNRETNPNLDNDFNDLVFTVDWDPDTCVDTNVPQIDPEASCQAVKTHNPDAGSGVYDLDPCGTNTPTKYYCDMETPGANGVVGGWTVGGWQPANATSTLGVVNRGAVLDSNWSRKLQCLSFNEALVFNRTHGKYFTETLPGEQFRVTTVPFALGVPGRSFNQGTYVGNTMMGCVSYNYDNSLDAQWGCTTDPWFGGTARGHIADDALQYNCDPAVLGQWAWADNTSCSHIDQMYTWGIGVR